MPTLKEKIIELLKVDDGFTDREITDKIMGHGKPQQNVNIACRDIESRGMIQRVKRTDGKIGNYLTDSKINNNESHFIEKQTVGMSEDEIKEIINNDLISKGWKTNVAWEKVRGIAVFGQY
ncbi:hypothetical protein ACIQXV_26525 [Neobacillus sp. NPDC097160]|uniref:hypothetical protein n=1 Tax=Neobacillus sp. NPDC097160 TaxID=3364298 RepID=UPI0037FE1EDA